MKFNWDPNQKRDPIKDMIDLIDKFSGGETKMKDMFNKIVLNKIRTIVQTDQFDDTAQNVEQYEGFVSEIFLPQKWALEFCGNNLNASISVLEVGCGSGNSFPFLPITHAIEPHPERVQRAKKAADILYKEPSSELKGIGRKAYIIDVQEGWAENLPYDTRKFYTVICWGTLCFVRSLMETLMETNRVLEEDIGGYFIGDVVTSTTLPIAQTVDWDSFRRFLSLFGFRICAYEHFGTPWHTRVGFLAKKERSISVKEFQMPQLVGGEIKNFHPPRDWYMK